jgi:hypothetical protein
MGNLRQYRELMDEGGLSALGAENPKRHDFAFDFLGHKRPVMDEQMVSGMTPGMPSAPGKQYGIYSRVASEEAAARGVDPRNFQEVGWAGFRGKEGQPMIGVVNDTIERNHRLTGMPRNEILRGIIRGNIPIYGLGAGVMAPGVIETSPIDQ